MCNPESKRLGRTFQRDRFQTIQSAITSQFTQARTISRLGCSETSFYRSRNDFFGLAEYFQVQKKFFLTFFLDLYIYRTLFILQLVTIITSTTLISHYIYCNYINKKTIENSISRKLTIKQPDSMYRSKSETGFTYHKPNGLNETRSHYPRSSKYSTTFDSNFKNFLYFCHELSPNNLHNDETCTEERNSLLIPEPVKSKIVIENPNLRSKTLQVS